MQPLTFTPKMLAVGAAVLIILALVPSLYFYQKYRSLAPPASINSQKTQLETTDLVAKISKHIVLPQAEIPTLATVSDITKLKKQEFFAKAQNGDKVLLYLKAKKAILYRPSLDKIIDVGPIYLPSPAEASAQAGASREGGPSGSPTPTLTPTAGPTITTTPATKPIIR